MKTLSAKINSWPIKLAYKDVFEESSLHDFAIITNSISSKSARNQNPNIFPDLTCRKLGYRRGYNVSHKGYNHRNGFVLSNVATFQKILTLAEATKYGRN